MEIRRWHYYIIFNCVFIKYLEAKTISLNDVITAESQQKEAFETVLPARSAGSSSKRYSLFHRLRTSPSRIKNILESGFLRDHSLLGGNILSPLTYRKTYLIKSPLKPRKLKFIQKSRYKKLSNTIRTYPYYFQEIPLAVGETIMESVREAAPHITETLKEISPGIMEIMNMIPDAERMSPVHKMMKRIPTVLHETVQEAFDSQDQPELETIPDYFREEIKPPKSPKSPRKQKQPMTAIEKINSKLEETKQKAEEFYKNLFEDYEDSYPQMSTKMQSLYNPKKYVKKASSISHTITPVINESLTEVAQLPKKIKKFVQEMKQ
ncbi:hypothetical protein PYW07_001688 [Mythimna separata]|uniref:Uncharacterized protein n=1 Tax=Mythimna separata TaxID=271217 RepID=A0AAD7YV35_MYTSE|nr:hypothetical protein PYW07_001688 [Mythimna separata]